MINGVFIISNQGSQGCRSLRVPVDRFPRYADALQAVSDNTPLQLLPDCQDDAEQQRYIREVFKVVPSVTTSSTFVEGGPW